MNLKAFLSHLLKKDTPDEEECVDVPQKSQTAASQVSTRTKDPEKVGIDAGVTEQTDLTSREDDGSLEHNDDNQEYDDALPDVDLEVQPDTSPRGPRRLFSRIFTFICPSPNDEEEIQAYIPHYRILPIFSGITIPFCILLDIPGLTADWYIRTSGSTIIASKPNPPLLDAGIALSLLCAVLANLCLVVRFLERRIKTMTILCTIFLSIHGKLTVIYPLL